VPLKGDKRTRPGRPGGLPDMAVCRVRRHADCLFTCQVETPQDCEYALPFGKQYFCSSPDRDAIAARTRVD